MFLGEHEHTLDDKGRVVLPSAFRKQMEGEYVITKGRDHCLEAWSREAFEERVAQLRQLPMENKAARRDLRLFISSAQPLSPDAQGRIVLEPQLRSYARLDRRLLINGLYDRFEIWDHDSWQTYVQAGDESYADVDVPVSAS